MRKYYSNESAGVRWETLFFIATGDGRNLPPKCGCTDESDIHTVQLMVQHDSLTSESRTTAMHIEAYNLQVGMQGSLLAACNGFNKT